MRRTGPGRDEDAEDAVRGRFATFIVEDATRFGSPTDWPTLKSRLQALGMRFVLEDEIGG